MSIEMGDKDEYTSMRLSIYNKKRLRKIGTMDDNEDEVLTRILNHWEKTH